MCGLRYVSPSHSSRTRCAAQAQVGTHIIAEPQPPACSRGKDTGPGESGRQAQTSLGHVIGSNVRLARSCVAHSSSTEDRCWHGNGDGDGREEREAKRKTGDSGEAPRRNRPARRTVVPWTASEGCGREIPFWWHAPGACRTSSLVLPACRQHSLHGWPLVCAFGRGREERQFLSALCFSFFFWWGGGDSTIHCHRNDLEVSGTDGNTQISTSRMLRKYLVYETP